MNGCLVSEWMNEQMSPDLHSCIINGEKIPGLVYSPVRKWGFVHITISSCRHFFWRVMETQWQRTETYEMLRGRNIESRVCILPCEHRSHPCDSLLLVAIWGAKWDQASLEVRSLFPKEAKSLALLGCLWGSVGNISKALRLQSFDDVCGSLFSF